MGKRTSHAPGTFSWVDLATPDPEAAKSFYGELFGWEMDDQDAGEGAVYTICRLGGDAVCGLFELPEEMRAGGMPPSWTSYVTVGDADTAAARALELGGAAIKEPFDVMDAGRTAVVRDPQGAVLAMWEPRQRIGAEQVNDAGCLVMNELATTHLDGAAEFYAGLFGWTTETITSPDAPAMVMAMNDGRMNASLGEAEGGAPPHWRPYFTVESAADAVARVAELGGAEVMPPVTIFDGTIAVVQDPQGAAFAVYEGEVDP